MPKPFTNATVCQKIQKILNMKQQLDYSRIVFNYPFYIIWFFSDKVLHFQFYVIVVLINLNLLKI